MIRATARAAPVQYLMVKDHVQTVMHKRVDDRPHRSISAVVARRVRLRRPCPVELLQHLGEYESDVTHSSKQSQQPGDMPPMPSSARQERRQTKDEESNSRDGS